MPMDALLQQHSGELMIILLSAFLVIALLVLIPQLIRAHQHLMELQHTEHLQALERGLPLPQQDERSLFAGRTALLVPIVSICTAGTVTCFLVAYRSEIIFSVSLAVWCVAGIISLAAITGGVALLGRLAHLHSGREEDEFPENPLGK
jgi:hypothetical protein